MLGVMSKLRPNRWDSGPISGRARRGIIMTVAAAALLGGGTVLGINLQSSDNGARHPATAPGGGALPGATTTLAPAPTPTRRAGATKVRVFCTGVSGTLSGTLTLSGCNQPRVTGGSGTFPDNSLGTSGSVTVTWNGTGTTTLVYSMAKEASRRNRCPAGQAESVLSGSVTASDPLGPGDAGVRGPVHAKLCIDPGSRVSLLAGQTFKL